MATTNKVEFNTRTYEASHGAPKGRGGWGFSFAGEGETDPARYDVSKVWFVRGSMTYGEAKVAAKAEARRQAEAVNYRGTVVVFVQP